MIKFFRQIRQRLLSENKFSKYLLYAIGEIILVVIGILIAIGLNNSNQLKTLNKNVDLQLSILRQAVYQDSVSFRGLINYSGKKIMDADRLLQLLNSPINDENCDEFVNTFNDILQVRTTIADRSIYEEMVSSGAFSKIKNQQLKSQIATYYQLSKHFDDILWVYAKDFREFQHEISSNGTIARSYFDKGSLVNEQERCAYIKSLIENNEKKQLLENYVYTGKDTYKQISNLYSVLLNQIIKGLPEKGDSE